MKQRRRIVKRTLPAQSFPTWVIGGALALWELLANELLGMIACVVGALLGAAVARMTSRSGVQG